MIIAVIGLKGGTGKTTLAVHLAGWRAVSGRDVMLIDSDKQKTSLNWTSRREELGLPAPYCTQQTGRGIRRSVRDFSRRYSDVIVDIGAGDITAIQTVLRVADVGIVPAQPNELDIWTLGDLDYEVSEAKELNERLVVGAVINRAPSHHAALDTDAALKALATCENIEVTGCVIKERTSIRRSVPAGYLIDEWTPPDKKAQAELSMAYNFVFGENDQSLTTEQPSVLYAKV